MNILVIKQKIQNIKEEEVNTMKNHINKLEKEFIIGRNQWTKIIQDNNAELERIKKLWQENRKRYIEQKNKQKNEITELKQQLMDRNEQYTSKTNQNIMDNLRFTKKKEQNLTQYENGITFLDRQLKRATIKIKEKDRQISGFIKQLTSLKKQHQEEINFIKNKNKEEKYNLEQKINWLNEDLQEINELNRKKQKQLTLKQNKNFRIKERLNEQNEQLKNIIKQMQSDFHRITGKKEQIQEDYRTQRDNSILGKITINDERKKKISQLERQRYQLEISYKQKETRIKNNHQIQLRKLEKQNQKIKLENQGLKGQIGKLQGLIRKQKQVNTVNKQNLLSEYSKKASTIELQISLLSRLYNDIHQTDDKNRERQQLNDLSQQQSLSEQVEDKEQKQNHSSSQQFQHLIKQNNNPFQTSALKGQKQEKISQIEEKPFDLLLSFNPKIDSKKKQ